MIVLAKNFQIATSVYASFGVLIAVYVVLLVISVVLMVKHAMEDKRTRTNLDAPAERVYDYADVLTEEQEEKLLKKFYLN